MSRCTRGSRPFAQRSSEELRGMSRPRWQPPPGMSQPPLWWTTPRTEA